MSEWDDLPSPQQKERAIAIRPTGTVGWPQGTNPQPSEWDALPQAKAPPPASGSAADAMATNGPIADVLHAFGQGFKDEWGAATFGPELEKAMEKAGVLFNPEGKGGPTVAQAFNEAWLRPLAHNLLTDFRTMQAVGFGLHEASIAAGHPWDSLAAGMEAFPLAGAELGRIGWATTRASLAKTGDTRIDAILDDPETRRAVSNPVVNDQNDVPYSAGPDKVGDGLNIDRNFPKSFTIDGKTFNPAEPFAVHEFVERDTMERLTKGGMAPDAAYRVAHYEFAEKAEGAWYAANGIDQAKAEAAYQPYIKRIDHENPNNPPPNLYTKPYPHSNVHAQEAGPVEATPPTPQEIEQAHAILDREPEKIAAVASKIEGKVYQASNHFLAIQNAAKERGEDVLDTLRLFEEGKAEDGFVTDTGRFVSRAEANKIAIASGQKTKGTPGLKELGELGHSDFVQARALGVIGPEPKSISEPIEKPPKEVQPYGNPMATKGLSETNFNGRVKAMSKPGDVRALIEDATEHPGFQPARQGEIPAEHLGRLSDITGIPVEQLPEAKMRLNLNGDAQYRVAGQILIQAQDNVFEAARAHRALKTFETRQALVEAIMRRDLALEEIVGLNAEWGRTGNAIQDLYENVKSAQDLGRFIKERKGEGWNSEKIDQIADDISKMNSREAVGRYLTEQRKPNFMDKAIWYWTNSILSGPITHAKYVLANSAYLAHDTFIATPLAGISGAIRQALSPEEINRVYLGETVAKTYGLIAGVPDAIMAAAQAVKTNTPTSLEAQIRGTSNISPITQLAPVKGVVGEAMSGPSRVIGGIHSFFNFLGYRAEIEAQAYRRAAKDGLKPYDREFWQRQAEHANYPDDAMMDAGILAGQRANFVQDLGPVGKDMQRLLYRSRVGRFIIPFTKVPINIAKAIQEGTPLAFLPEKYAEFKKSGPERDMFIGRLAAGSAVMGYAAYLTLQDKITGNGPIDPKQRAEWLLTHQPHSFQLNGRWYSYDRFGPVGGLLSLAADVTDTARDLEAASHDGRMTETEVQKANRDLEEGYARAVALSKHFFDEAGFQGLSDFVSALNDPNHTRVSAIGTLASTWLPYSSAQSQIASFNDPLMRDTQTFLDGIKKTIPGARSTLPMVPDWSGQPKPNPAYHSLVRTQATNNDPVDLEMQRLDLKPSKVEDNIRGVKLTREQYNEYQTLAGAATRQLLEHFINQPGWHLLPDYAKVQVIMGAPFKPGLISAGRKQAEAAMQIKYMNTPLDVVKQGMDNRMIDISGKKEKPTAYPRPQ